MLEKITALLDGLRPEDLDNVPPAKRQQFASLARHWAGLAERRQEPQQQQGGGVLSDLRRGQRQE